MASEDLADPEAEHLPAFRLRRYFSIASLIGLLAILLLLTFFYRQIAFQAIERQETRANVAIAHRLVHQRWAQFARFIRDASAVPPTQLMRDPAVALMRAELGQALGLDSTLSNIVKLKLYTPDGLTVYSTDDHQIGELEEQNPGFLAAKNGEVATQILYKDTFDGYEGVLVDRNLASVYMPVRRGAGASILGVMEIYSDVTPLVEHLNEVQWKIIAGVTAAFAVLYLFLFAIVDRAARILQRQEHLRRQHQELIRHQAYHDSLTGLPNRRSFNLDSSVDRFNLIATD